ncbi:MAG: GNAT family N-acetyltransferase [Acidobacteriaceae bacterium]|jgi:putative acetyltransferase|nr:GNAT family N-acetyltransferase [Acidobacteriaceae bacterium]
MARPSEIETVRLLFREYQQHLGIDLCFQNFEQELAGLPGKYTGIWLAEADGELAGIVALRPWAEGIGEMKRLYVRPRFHGRGLGKALAATVVAAARQSGDRALRLDTLASMAAAVAIYRAMGFREIEPYTLNPVPGALFLELSL